MIDFENIFSNHKKWVDSAGITGEQINLDGVDMRSISIENQTLEQGYYSECNFNGKSFENIDFYQSEFYSCKFEHSTFIGCDFRKVTTDYCIFEGSIFVDCKFPHTDAFKSVFDNCSFKDCSFIGFNLMEGSMNNAVLENVDFDEAYFDTVRIVGICLIGPKNIEKINHISIQCGENDSYFENAEAVLWMKEHIVKEETDNT